MTKYKFELTVKEGYDEFWEDVNKKKVPQDKVIDMIKEGMYRGGMMEGEDYDITFVCKEEG